MENIELKGIEFLNEAEREVLSKEVEKYQEKIKWKTKSDFVLKLAVKEYNKNPENKDKRKKYSLKGEITGETQNFESSVLGWDFNKAVHQVFEKLLNEIEHAYHSSEQRGSGKNQ